MNKIGSLEKIKIIKKKKPPTRNSGAEEFTEWPEKCSRFDGSGERLCEVGGGNFETLQSEENEEDPCEP